MISLIAAVSRNDVIGRDNGLPWDLPADLKHFREVTVGHPVVMGRKTFESIGRPLPNRKNIVITRNSNYVAEGITIAGSLAEAIEKAKITQSGELEEEVFVIGGGEIFREALPLADKVYLTRVDTEISGGAYFPKLDPGEWQQVYREDGVVDEKNILPHTFLVYEKQSNI